MVNQVAQALSSPVVSTHFTACPGRLPASSTREGATTRPLSTIAPGCLWKSLSENLYPLSLKDQRSWSPILHPLQLCIGYFICPCWLYETETLELLILFPSQRRTLSCHSHTDIFLLAQVAQFEVLKNVISNAVVPAGLPGDLCLYC